MQALTQGQIDQINTVVADECQRMVTRVRELLGCQQRDPDERALKDWVIQIMNENLEGMIATQVERVVAAKMTDLLDNHLEELVAKVLAKN